MGLFDNDNYKKRNSWCFSNQVLPELDAVKTKNTALQPKNESK